MKNSDISIANASWYCLVIFGLFFFFHFFFDFLVGFIFFFDLFYHFSWFLYHCWLLYIWVSYGVENFKCTEYSDTSLSLAAAPILSPNSSRICIDNLLGCIGVPPNLAGTCWSWLWTLPLMWPLGHLPFVDPRAPPLSCSRGWGCCGFAPGSFLYSFSLV